MMNDLNSVVSATLSGDHTVVISNENTTIGYATFDPDRGEVTYIFVHPGFRTRGFGTMLVDAARQAAGQPLKPSEPVSPLGRMFFERIAHRRGTERLDGPV
jgi:GNAT superfamily N-acetyltransferase